MTCRFKRPVSVVAPRHGKGRNKVEWEKIDDGPRWRPFNFRTTIIPNQCQKFRGKQGPSSKLAACYGQSSQGPVTRRSDAPILIYSLAPFWSVGQARSYLLQTLHHPLAKVFCRRLSFEAAFFRRPPLLPWKHLVDRRHRRRCAPPQSIRAGRGDLSRLNDGSSGRVLVESLRLSGQNFNLVGVDGIANRAQKLWITAIRLSFIHSPRVMQYSTVPIR
ncbi:hypothetical protein BO83DRAFT_477 [Aspergillus eucalypticola CBS 122712]|uniref:Uncharacterized protein n=1 Tax=Aspergillus eucalypticola (strain CBS 122712 / IBT 29274) TaxID=1448314 RepID=A0A317WFE0_ASPEC|nr:uncharacterized protein BO83DRAFT_477 [Aspergillus eucalypticola CBS 122712]PWY85133.1 hypothetical protein BO83DRAFT_477 [Aspergillus eucalypticola CBS 122712]